MVVIMPLRIIIVGAGISGLANYLFLRKYLATSAPDATSIAVDIRILEAYNEPQRSGADASFDSDTRNPTPIGGGLGVGPNGLRVVKALDPAIHAQIRRSGYPVHKFQFNSAGGSVLGCFNAGYGDEPCQMIMRQDVWNPLRAHVPDDAIHWNCRVDSINSSEDDGIIKIVTANGTTYEADLLIGADGLRSAIRKHLYDDAYPAHYEGLIGLGGIHPSSALPPLPPTREFTPPRSPCVMTFGSHGFVGYAPASQEAEDPPTLEADSKPPCYGPQAMWWSIYEYNSDPTGALQLDIRTVREELIKRHGGYGDPHLVEFVTNGSIIGLWPQYTVDKLPEFHCGSNIVLTGDAAHALPSSSGQGVSQAFEDAQALGLLLAHYLGRGEGTTEETFSKYPSKARAHALGSALEKFTALRKPRVDAILDFARRMGDHKRKKGMLEEWLTYGAMWLFTRIPNKSWEKDLFGYDVAEAVQGIVDQS